MIEKKNNNKKDAGRGWVLRTGWTGPTDTGRGYELLGTTPFKVKKHELH